MPTPTRDAPPARGQPCSICGVEIAPHYHPITGAVYWSQGHNAEPVTDGRCCDLCNHAVVIPVRLSLGRAATKEEVKNWLKHHSVPNPSDFGARPLKWREP